MMPQPRKFATGHREYYRGSFAIRAAPFRGVSIAGNFRRRKIDWRARSQVSSGWKLPLSLHIYLHTLPQEKVHRRKRERERERELSLSPDHDSLGRSAGLFGSHLPGTLDFLPQFFPFSSASFSSSSSFTSSSPFFLYFFFSFVVFWQTLEGVGRRAQSTRRRNQCDFFAG